MTYTAEEIEKLLAAGALERIGMGSRRACYRLPDGKHCLKCYRSDAEIAEGRHPGRSPASPLVPAVVREIQRFRFDERRNICCLEQQYWSELKRRLPEDLMSAFPTTIEMVLVATRGWCEVEERVVNADGSPVMKIHEAWVQADELLRKKILDAFDTLMAKLAKWSVRMFDPQSLFVQKMADGSIRLRILDFEPVSRTFFALENLSSAVVRMKIRRRFSRYRKLFASQRASVPEGVTNKAAPVNVLCLKWGNYYGPEYVNRLYAGVKRNLHRPFRFVCVTDDASGLVDGVEAVPMPEAPLGWNHSWPHIFIKLLVFKDGFAGLAGPTLFLDIDQVIIGDMGVFFDHLPGRFCMIHNWIEWRKRLFRRRPDIGNSSCFRFEAGSMNYVYEKFMSEMQDAVNTSKFRTEQAFMTHAVGIESVNWWPEPWVASFKRRCAWLLPLNLLFVPRRPPDARILCFHGHPNPEEAICGYRGKKFVHVNERTLPAKWVRDLWYLAGET